MKLAAMAAFGWLVPGGAYLWNRRYFQFGVAIALVCGALVPGIALQGANLWPAPAELQGLDGFSAGLARAGAFAKTLAGLPYMLTLLLPGSQSFLAGETHEYGTTLFILAGLLNLLALADGLALRKGKTV